MLQADVTHKSANASQFDRRLFRSKVVSIDKSRFERRQESVKSVSIELVYQICVKIFSFAMDKRTKNKLYMHRVSVFITTYSSIETFASIELIFGFNRMNSRSKQPSIELTLEEGWKTVSSTLRLGNGKLWRESLTIFLPIIHSARK